MSNKKNEYRDINISNSGGDGMHLNPEAGSVTVISNATVSGSTGHGIYLGEPSAPPPAAPAKKFRWKAVAAVLIVLAAVTAFVADGTQVLESQTLKDFTGWLKSAQTPEGSRS